ncbi:MAG: DNA adenine methylase [Clostridia bacterium]|nr:DNA adenine methylase [Clostridia bacterium]
MGLNIENRRYIGNKSKLLKFIDDTIKKEKIRFCTFGDVFSGTGVVAEYFLNKGKEIYVNDLLFSNFVIYKALLSNEKYEEEKIIKIIDDYNRIDVEKIQDNYFSDNFSGNYYHYKDAKKIGYVREDIENRYLNKEINDREYYILISCLLYSMDRISNTVGHYESFLNKEPEYKNLQISNLNIKLYNSNSHIYNEDANSLVRKIKVDVMYIDPPYNARQYANFYHLLENVAQWKKPKVYNKAKKMERKNIMSEYCKANAKTVFTDLIENINAKYIIVSYNNTYEAKSTSSVNSITYNDMMQILEKKGKVSVYETDYKFFNSGKTNLDKHKERLFVCKVEE